MAEVKTYAPEDISLIVGVKQIRGFDLESMIKIEIPDSFTKVVSADGDVTRIHSSDKTSKITINLLQSSDANDYFSGLVLADQATKSGIVPVLIKDALGNSLYVAESAWLTKMVDGEFNRSISSRPWVIETGKLAAFTGGNR